MFVFVHAILSWCPLTWPYLHCFFLWTSLKYTCNAMLYVCTHIFKLSDMLMFWVNLNSYYNGYESVTGIWSIFPSPPMARCCMRKVPPTSTMTVPPKECVPFCPTWKLSSYSSAQPNEHTPGTRSEIYDYSCGFCSCILEHDQKLKPPLSFLSIFSHVCNTFRHQVHK